MEGKKDRREGQGRGRRVGRGEEGGKGRRRVSPQTKNQTSPL